ncbi:hypothetical protein [uncultured phage cr6_1]|uniref:Uncharacterized protein n=1 Tax=uncultured phage cr6_1 TaxID=2772085 RepID=A0A7M1RW43_9CAUD|nr:hypothetical protein KNV52_gp35 [uncultured phage cr6_1]QOR57260.1 hypothetical protein [uncultured phage cr6_1]
MATNRFDKPIESEYISLYTPIPFELLYAIGKANNERVDKAYLDLGNQFTKWSEFRSPSAVDTKRWYDLTVGAGQDIVNKLAANPDLIKTAEGRSLIQSFINTRPYNELSLLQLSREGLLLRLKVNQQLMLSGKYNPMWHDVDFSNYNTLDSGVFNDVAPLAYKSEVDLVKPYVDNLKPGYIRSDGSYDYSGVSTDRTDKQIAKNISAIYNTPEAQMHINTLVRLGFTPDRARALFTDRIYRAGREFAYEDRELNPLSKIYKEQQATWKPFRLTESIATTGGDAFKLGTQAYIANKYRDQINSLTDQYNKAVESNDTLSANIFKEQLRKIYNESNSYTPNKLFNEIFKEYATDGKLTNIDLSNATNDILNRFAAPSPIASVNDLLQTTIPGITSETVTTPLGKYRVIANPRQLDLATDVISEIAGYKHVESGKNKFRDALKNGKLTNVILQQGGNILTLPVNKNGQVQPNSSLVITVAIPQSQLDALGITDADMVISGAKRIYDRSGKVSLSTEIKEGDKRKLPFQRYLEEGEYSSKYNYEGKVSYNVPTEDVYWLIELLNKLPDPQDKLNTEYLDQQAWKLSITDAFRSELYPSTQQEAYGIGYSAGEEEK